MLTINSKIFPVNFNKNSNSKKSGVNFSLPQNEPSKDVFIKNNVSFNGAYKMRKSLGLDYDNYDLMILNKELGKTLSNAWRSVMAIKKEEYGDIDLTMPSVRLLQEDEKEIDEQKLGKGKTVHYDWVNNVITVNKNSLPNVAIIARGKVDVTPHKKALDFLTSKGLEPSLFKSARSMDINDALEKSKDWRNCYFKKLAPEETAELVGAAMVNEIDRMITTHIMYNTKGIGAEFVKPYIKELYEVDRLPKYGRHGWDRTYPGRYSDENRGKPIFNGNDVMNFKVDDLEVNIQCKDLPKYIFDPDANNKTNPVDLKAKAVALLYCKAHKEYRAHSKNELLKILLDMQEKAYSNDIEKRVEEIKKSLEKENDENTQKNDDIDFLSLIQSKI